MTKYRGRYFAGLTVVCSLYGCGSGESQPDATATAGSGNGVEAKLGLTQADGQRASLDALISGSGWYLIGAIANGFKALPADDKGDAIEVLGLDMKRYFESDTFAEAYAARRADAKPVPTESKGSVDDELERQHAEQRKSIEDTRSMLANMPDELRAQIEESIKGSIASSEAMLEDDQMAVYQRQAIEAQRAQEKINDAQSLKRWQEEYPEDPKPLIERRLKDFLAVSADVDFDAELAEANDKMKFVNPDYENKPQEWKWCFRAGKASVESAREVATMWLDDL